MGILLGFQGVRYDDRDSDRSWGRDDSRWDRRDDYSNRWGDRYGTHPSTTTPFLYLTSIQTAIQTGHEGEIINAITTTIVVTVMVETTGIHILGRDTWAMARCHVDLHLRMTTQHLQHLMGTPLRGYRGRSMHPLASILVRKRAPLFVAQNKGVNHKI